jgi:predicted DNA-binding transcriptional regulator AlpA
MKEKIQTQYLTEFDVAAMTGISLSTLRNNRCVGKPPVYYKIGKSVRYKESEILSFMERVRVEPRIVK